MRGEQMRYKFSEFNKVLNYSGKIIIINTQNGKWIKITQKVHQILCAMEKQAYEQFLKSLYDEEDRSYIRNIVSKMVEMELLVEMSQRLSTNKIVLFEITNRCNLYCKHCCNNAAANSDFELSLQEVKLILKYLVSKNPAVIILSGGEPMIRNDFFEILEYLKSIYKNKISIMTNGTFITYVNAGQLVRYVNEINISLDGIDEKSCSKIRGKGVFDSVMEGINSLHKYKFYNITLSLVIGDNNRQFMKPFIELNAKLGTMPLIRGFVAAGRGIQNKAIYFDDSTFQNVEEYMTDEILEMESTKKISPCTCNAAREKILIDYKGDIYPCQWFREEEYCLGNALISKMENLNTETVIKKIKAYYPDQYEKCKDCEVNLFCWPCPGELRAVVEGNEQLEKICEKVKPILIHHIWEEVR